MGGRRLPQHQQPRTHMRVNNGLARAYPGHHAPHPAGIPIEGGCVNIAREDKGSHGFVCCGIADVNQHFAGAQQTHLVTVDVPDLEVPSEHRDCEACGARHFHGCGCELRKVFDFDENGISIPVNRYVSRLCRFGADIFDGHANVVVLRADNVSVPAGSSNFYSFAGLQAGDVGNIGTPNIISNSQDQQSESH